eukprot:TRINITY_DN14867_c0_g1_i1.p1 TRINITY_DN14867_c0_g1~~TRINITY_DN14867_c0_g1_i1.p1  ORF type:complete len:137 (+),score=21.38 TRINITY_DN14867_c0_g1_i1:54-464(+)
MSALKCEVLMTTGIDERIDVGNMIDGDEKTFWVTTGMYPHEIILGFKGAHANISKIRTWTYHVKKLIIEKSTETSPTKFTRFVELELSDKNASMQIESFQVNQAMGQEVRFLRIIIASGWDDFASVHSVLVEGETP